MAPMAIALEPEFDTCLHRNPPTTPSSLFAPRRPLLAGIMAAFGLLAVAAVIADAWLLLHWDEPFQRLVESNRNDGWDIFFRLASRGGSTIVVLTLGPLLAIVAWRRCRAVSIALLVATFTRPVLEFVLKRLVGRDRPELDQLVAGNGPSFPSGHPMAAMALWGLLPWVIGLFTNRRGLWWASVTASGLMIIAIAASRVYLGVHWLSDVVAGLLVGVPFLLGVEWVLRRAHRLPHCCSKIPDTVAPPPEAPRHVVLRARRAARLTRDS
jgi:undecaprenyl-diphosphatase